MIIGFYIWVFLTIPLLFIPLYFWTKGKPITPRELFFLIIGMWMLGGRELIQYIVQM